MCSDILCAARSAAHICFCARRRRAFKILYLVPREARHKKVLILLHFLILELIPYRITPYIKNFVEICEKHAEKTKKVLDAVRVKRCPGCIFWSCGPILLNFWYVIGSGEISLRVEFQILKSNSGGATSFSVLWQHATVSAGMKTYSNWSWRVLYRSFTVSSC